MHLHDYKEQCKHAIIPFIVIRILIIFLLVTRYQHRFNTTINVNTNKNTCRSKFTKPCEYLKKILLVNG